MSPQQRMMRIIVLTLVMTTMTPVKGGEVCYGRLGCFSDAYPWSGTLQRPQPALPWPPEKINTKFFLFTGEGPNSYQTISADNITTITSSKFQIGKKTCLIVHGMADKALNNWVSDMCQAILEAENVNCAGVDWRAGSGNVITYAQAANNIRVVGAEVAFLIETLKDLLGHPPSDIHLIGHSLGAHAAGDAGRRVPGIGRITGLDPAGPWFENTPIDVRLDPSDAEFVDVIHSDSKLFTGVGMISPIGHYDFYPNGGGHMTGCPNKISILSNSKDAFHILACNHFRSFLYFTYSVRHPGGLRGFPCDSYEDFLEGSCFPCPPGGCPSMGYYADSTPFNASMRQSFYLNTGGDVNHFSRWRYRVSVSLRGDGRVFGRLYVSLSAASGGNTSDHMVHRGLLVPGEKYSALVDSALRLHPTPNVTFHWSSRLNLFGVQLGAERIEVQTGEDGKIFSFCSNTTVPDSQGEDLDPCDEA